MVSYLGMIRVLTGSNDFMRSHALHELMAQFTNAHGDFGVETIEAGNVEFRRLLESVSSLPFLAPRRMIILLEPGSSKTLNDTIDDLLNAVSETTDLILVERKFDKRSVLYKTLKKRADVSEFNELDERTLPTWLFNEAKNRGGNISESDARYLVTRIGLGQLNASNELDKLLLYNPKVSRETIDLLTEKLPQSTVFELIEAAFSGNHKRAIELYQEQRKQQVEPQAIMGMIAWQVHAIALVKANEKLGSEDIARAAKMSPFVVRKTLQITSKMSLKEMKELLLNTLKLDTRLKSDATDADEALQHYLLTI